MWFLAWFGCTQGLPSAPQIAEIVVSPGEAQVLTGPTGAAPVAFQATALDPDGGPIDLPVFEWTLSNTSTGVIDEDGTFTASAANGGVTWVRARLGDVVGQATLTTIYQEVRGADGVDLAAFDTEATAVTDLWHYPEDGVNIPRNTPSLTFQWADLGPEATYRLRFRSRVTDLTVYTRANRWTADLTTWPLIVATNAGGQVDIELTALLAGQLTTQSRAVQVNRMDAHGAILYWAASASGIREIPYGQSAVDFLGPAQTGRCVACHAVSRDGLIAVTYDGGDGPMGVKRISDLTDVIPANGTARANFMTFSPDGRYLLGASHGALLLWDAQTGEFLHEVPIDGYATHPDWSPDGERVAFTRMDDGAWADWHFAGANAKIAVIDHLGDGIFGNQQALHDPEPPYIAYYPAWSPDGEWLAFNVSTGDSYDDPDAAVWVIDRRGNRPPIALDRANQTDGITNSWPRWAPLPDDDVLWLTFASRRAYGDVVQGLPQIWVSGFDPEKARAGEDPSWPAFWLPGQESTQSNHIPVWTE